MQIVCGLFESCLKITERALYLHIYIPLLYMSQFFYFYILKGHNNPSRYSKSFPKLHFPPQGPLYTPDDPIQKTKDSEDTPDNGTDCCQKGRKGLALLSLDNCHGRNIKVEKDT